MSARRAPADTFFRRPGEAPCPAPAAPGTVEGALAVVVERMVAEVLARELPLFLARAAALREQEVAGTQRADQDPAGRVLRLPEVLRLVGVKTSTLYEWESKGLFPRRRRLGRRTTAWDSAAVHAWLSENKEAAT